MKKILAFIIISSCSTNKAIQTHLYTYSQSWMLNMDTYYGVAKQDIAILDNDTIYANYLLNKIYFYDVHDLKLIKIEEDTLEESNSFYLKSLDEYVLQGKHGFLIRSKHKGEKYISKDSLSENIKIPDYYDFAYDFDNEVIIVRAYNYNILNKRRTAWSGLIIWDGKKIHKSISFEYDGKNELQNDMFTKHFFIQVESNKYTLSASHSNNYYIVEPKNSYKTEKKQLDFEYSIQHFLIPDDTIDRKDHFAIKHYNDVYKKKFGPLISLNIDGEPYKARLYFEDVEMSLIKYQKNRFPEVYIHVYKNDKIVKSIYLPANFRGGRTKLYSFENCIGIFETIDHINAPYNPNKNIIFKVYCFAKKEKN